MRFRIVAPVGLAAALVVGVVAQQRSHRVVTYCYGDVLRFWLGDGPIQASVPAGDQIAVRFDQGRFLIRRGTRTLVTFAVEDFSSNGLMLWSPDRRAFALTYSDGGAIGAFHVRVFLVHGDTMIEASKAIQPAVDAFKARHYCKTRGNNVSAIKWVHGSTRLMLMTDVYPSGDCGPDAGHAEGYLVTVPGGRIERQLTVDQLENFPGICLENNEDR